jgi:hypothetical protein
VSSTSIERTPNLLVKVAAAEVDFFLRVIRSLRRGIVVASASFLTNKRRLRSRTHSRLIGQLDLAHLFIPKMSFLRGGGGRIFSEYSSFLSHCGDLKKNKFPDKFIFHVPNFADNYGSAIL